MYYLYTPLFRLFPPHLNCARYIVQRSQINIRSEQVGVAIREIYCEKETAASDKVTSIVGHDDGGV
jgi:hypothetical protein